MDNFKSISRTPPPGVRQALRAEVGFACPVENCGCPLLEYHHFDPPWRVRNHHNPEGMIALCATHHGEADAYTVKQCQEMKLNGLQNAKNSRWKFKWLRNEILLLLGSNWFYKSAIAFEYRREPVIWFTRDIHNNLLLNLRMLTTSDEPRAVIINHEWISVGKEADIEAPPSAKRVKIAYPNGDLLKVEFFPFETFQEASAKYDHITLPGDLVFPLIIIEIDMEVANSSLKFNSKEICFGTNRVMSCFFSHCRAAISYDGTNLMLGCG